MHSAIGYRALERGDFESAWRAFHRASLIHPGHFRHWLALAAAYRAGGKNDVAMDAYARSAELLPTADAFIGLADLVSDGSVRLSLLEQAAVATGPSGREAARRLFSEDFGRSADRLLRWSAGVDNRARVYVEILNPLAFNLGDVIVTIFCDKDMLVKGTVSLEEHGSAILLAPGALSPACVSASFHQDEAAVERDLMGPS